jgi:hypothetical protein
MIGFVELPSMTGPALVRVDRVVLVRPHPSGAAQTLLVLDGGHELIVTKPAADVVREMKAG